MSGNYPHLTKAPIVEGLVDLRAILPEGLDVRKLQDFDPDISSRYPRVDTQYGHEGQLRFSPEGMEAIGSVAAIRGYRRKSPDGLNIVQFRRDGFTFSRLAPYENWSRMYSEAMRLWASYVKFTNPHGVTRLATRFINRFNLGEVSEISDYLRTSPVIPESLPQGVASFMVRYVSVIENERLFSNVTIATDQKAASGQYPIIFDIDCFFPDLEFSVAETSAIDALFERLHDMKNQIFFETLTPKALEWFK